MYGWMCVSCGHEVWTQSDEMPVFDNWSDGHVCRFRRIEEEKEEVDKEDVFAYLDALRESGSINMFGAAPYVASEFGVDKREARELTLAWMENFGKEVSS